MIILDATCWLFNRIICTLCCPSCWWLLQLFSHRKHFGIPWAYSVFPGANHTAASTEMRHAVSAPRSQLWLDNCGAATRSRASPNATQLALGGVVWLAAGAATSCAETFLRKGLEIYRKRPPHITITGIRLINGTTKIARIRIAPVVCAVQFWQLCALAHPSCLSPCGRSSSSRGGGWMWQETGHWAAASFSLPNSPMSPDRMMIIGLLLNVFSHGEQLISHFQQLESVL